MLCNNVHNVGTYNMIICTGTRLGRMYTCIVHIHILHTTTVPMCNYVVKFKRKWIFP